MMAIGTYRNVWIAESIIPLLSWVLVASTLPESRVSCGGTTIRRPLFPSAAWVPGASGAFASVGIWFANGLSAPAIKQGCGDMIWVQAGQTASSQRHRSVEGLFLTLSPKPNELFGPRLPVRHLPSRTDFRLCTAHEITSERSWLVGARRLRCQPSM
jgi:hypothetical protein